MRGRFPYSYGSPQNQEQDDEATSSDEELVKNNNAVGGNNFATAVNPKPRPTSKNPMFSLFSPKSGSSPGLDKALKKKKKALPLSKPAVESSPGLKRKRKKASRTPEAVQGTDDLHELQQQQQQQQQDPPPLDNGEQMSTKKKKKKQGVLADKRARMVAKAAALANAPEASPPPPATPEERKKHLAVSMTTSTTANSAPSVSNLIKAKKAKKLKLAAVASAAVQVDTIPPRPAAAAPAPADAGGGYSAAQTAVNDMMRRALEEDQYSALGSVVDTDSSDDDVVNAVLIPTNASRRMDQMHHWWAKTQNGSWGTTPEPPTPFLALAATSATTDTAAQTAEGSVAAAPAPAVSSVQGPNSTSQHTFTRLDRSVMLQAAKKRLRMEALKHATISTSAGAPVHINVNALLAKATALHRRQHLQSRKVAETNPSTSNPTARVIANSHGIVHGVGAGLVSTPMVPSTAAVLAQCDLITLYTPEELERSFCPHESGDVPVIKHKKNKRGRKKKNPTAEDAEPDEAAQTAGATSSHHPDSLKSLGISKPTIVTPDGLTVKLHPGVAGADGSVPTLSDTAHVVSDNGDEDLPAPVPPPSNATWVQCDFCKKWRRLRGVVDSKKLVSSKWYCTMNKGDPDRSKCTAPEEEYDASPTTPESMAEIKCRKQLRMWVRRLQVQDNYEARMPSMTRLQKIKAKLEEPIVENPKRKQKPPVLPKAKVEPYEWIRCCNPSCGKWRALLKSMDKQAVMDSCRDNKWYCVLNTWDDKMASCAAPQENLPVLGCPPWVLKDVDDHEEEKGPVQQQPKIVKSSDADE